MSRSNGDSVKEAARNIPVYKKVGVLVCGGGSAGQGAAVAAARNGAEVLLVERNPYLGGEATAAFQVAFGGFTDIMTGIPFEMIQRLDKLGAARLPERYRKQNPETGIRPVSYWTRFDPEVWKFVASDMVEESGAKILTNTLAVDVILENQKVKGIVIENKSGRQAILADIVIDASGDADIAARAGVPIDKIPKGNNMPMTMVCRVGGVNYQKIADYARKHPDDFMPRSALPFCDPDDFMPGLGVPPGDFDGENLASIQGIGGWRSVIKELKEKGEIPDDFYDVFSLQTGPSAIKRGIGYIWAAIQLKRDHCDAQDVCEAEFEGRKGVRRFVEVIKKIPGLESSFLIDVAPSIGYRDSRRIIGEYVLTRKDINEGRTFDDDITLVTITWPDIPVSEEAGYMGHPLDGSGPAESGKVRQYAAGQERIPYFQVVFGIPYRCLIPKKVDGLLVAGHTISMTYMAHEPGPCRGMVTCMATGQAAGTAAAMAVKQGISPRQVDIPTLRKQLESQGLNLRKEVIDLSEIQKLVESRGDKISYVA